MKTHLCRGLPADWWDDVQDDGARLALSICRRCPSQDECADGDPAPHGVIRGGNAYSTTGGPAEVCASCGYPQVGSTGAAITFCSRCSLPPLWPYRAEMQRGRAAGFTCRQIGRPFGATPDQVRLVLRDRRTSTTQTKPVDEGDSLTWQTKQ